MRVAAKSACPAPLVELFRELGDLKRVRSAGLDGSVAQRLFADGWRRLLAGHPPAQAMRGNTAAVLAAARLGDLNDAALDALGLDPAERLAVLERGFDSSTDVVATTLRAALRNGLADPAPPALPLPEFVTRLAGQPRAGVTCPDKPRILLEPPENHAEHCLMVAAYGVLLSPGYGADPATVWLAGMAHHLHNALIPDSGFTGEMLLGEHLLPVMERATEHSLAQLPPALADTVRNARRILPDADTPEGRAFHAADTLDRVLQIAQHLRAGQTTMRFVLHDMALVHEGPVKAFQDQVLAEAGLLA
ncbi:HD domain-containing protein [Roseomonas sp. BN140053]|uniref:HD domain-containing protein n=1 Tax=Roseomonas sp. BN140053 TaxID=3391898 RepID=UPI0039E8074F